MFDYEKIGLKIGIEIHQQLDTHKLFCNCPSLLRKDKPDIIVRRKLYASAGELGEVDVAAAYEESRKRQFVYEAYSDSTCLVELDEEPPHNINEEALKIALQISLLLNAKPLNITQVMRKTVVDGSNTSGFQRTLLIARDGFVKVNGKKIKIDTICLEEDSARIIKQEKRKVIFRLDRLGIPLVEIATAPEVMDPKEAKEVALEIGKVLRSCKVKRGIGTIRQDVNLSIKGGERIEIKGVQKPELIPKVIENEVKRQLELLKKGKKIEAEVRKANEDGTTSFLRPLPTAFRMYPETDLPLIKITEKFIDEVKKSLPKSVLEIENELRKKLNEELVRYLLRENKIENYFFLLNWYDNPELVAKMLTIWQKEIASFEKIPLEKVKERLSLNVLKEILEGVKARKIDESYVKEMMREIARGKELEKVLEVKPINIEEVKKEIKRLIKEKPNLSFNAYMGLLMKKYKGKISGAKIAEILKESLK